MSLRRPDRASQHGAAAPTARPRSGPRAAAPPAEAPQRTRIQKAVQPPPSGGQRKAPQKRKGKIKKSTVVKVVILNLIKAGFVMLCIAAMVGSVAAVQVVQYVVESTTNDDTMLDLELYQMAQTSYMMVYNPDNPNAREEDDYIQYQELVGDEDRTWTPIHLMPDHLKNAVKATEDQEFDNHHGVNFLRSAAAFVNVIVPIPGMTGGASTIDQQLIKNITKEADVSGLDGFKRKLREMYRAYGLENQYSKDVILEVYLNTIGLSERIAGVGAGAKRYFNKEVQDLTLAECATIAGITQAPTKYSPIQNPDESLLRRNRVLGYMESCGYITPAQCKEAQAMPLGLRRSEAAQKTTGTFSWLADQAYNEVLDDLVEQGICANYAAAKQYIYNSGLRIYLTADLNIQSALDEIMVNGYDEGGFFTNEEMFPGYIQKMTKTVDITNAQGQVVDQQTILPQAAVAVVNYKGELIATSGGIGEKTTSLSLNRAIGTVLPDETGIRSENSAVQGTVRQNGSTMKPVAAYALGIDRGIISYSKMVPDSPVLPKTPGGPLDWPTNYGPAAGTNKLVPVAGALAVSLNTVPCQIGMWLGMEEMYSFLVDTLQITSLVEPNDISPAPLVLGSQTYGISCYELAGAYTMFGGDETYGMFNTLHSYSRVLDARGNVVLEPELATQQAISPETGYVMNRLLNNVLSNSTVFGYSPTAIGMRPKDADGNDIPSVAKTGTTSEDNDRWFVGLTPEFVTTVWWGYDTKGPNEQNTLRNWSPSARTNIPVNVWRRLVESTWQPGVSKADFPPMPQGVQQLQFCTISGNLAAPGCPTASGYYTSLGVPALCSGHADDMPAPAEPAA